MQKKLSTNTKDAILAKDLSVDIITKMTPITEPNIVWANVIVTTILYLYSNLFLTSQNSIDGDTSNFKNIKLTNNVVISINSFIFL